MAENDVNHKRSKHIDIRYHFVRDEVSNGNIGLYWIPSGEQIADIFTKTLPPRIFIPFRDILIRPSSSQTLTHAQRQ